jgi:hypothetical protein
MKGHSLYFWKIAHSPKNIPIRTFANSLRGMLFGVRSRDVSAVGRSAADRALKPHLSAIDSHICRHPPKLVSLPPWEETSF